MVIEVLDLFLYCSFSLHKGVKFIRWYRLKYNFSKILKITVIALAIFGVIMIYSASSIWAEYRYGNEFKFLISQGIFLLIGICLMEILSKIDYKIYKKRANTILIICLTLLALVLITGIGSVRNGSRSWFGIGGLGIQPSEIAKIGLIIFVSKYLSKNQREMQSIKKGIIPILSIILLFFGLIMLEPDFGTAMVITLTLVVMIFISEAKMSFFMGTGLIGIAGIVGLVLIAPYRMARIVSFLNPWTDPLGSGFQIIQSLYAIGSGGLFGEGLRTE